MDLNGKGAVLRGAASGAASLVEPLLEISDDPEYNAFYAQLLGGSAALQYSRAPRS